MLSVDQRVEYLAATATLDQLVLGDIETLIAGLDFADPPAIRVAIDAALPGLVAQYGNVAATIARQFYDLARADEGATVRFRPLLAKPAPREAIVASGRWATAPLWTPDGPTTPKQLVVDRLTGATTRHVRNVGRDTVAINADAEGARWARVPRAGACKFCVMVSSRGAVYKSEQTAGGGDARSYHDHCHCTPERIGRNEPLPYDADALYQQYLEARRPAS